MHPFELTVFHARVYYWAGDPLGYVDALSRILGRCKERAREEGRVVVQRREAVRTQGRGDVECTNQSERANEDEGKEVAEAAEESTESTEVQDEDETDETDETDESDESDESDDVPVAGEANLVRRRDDVDGTSQSGQANEDEGEADTEAAGERTENAGVQGKEDEGKEDAEAAEESMVRTKVQDEEDEPDDALVAAEANLSMWLERIARICLILASQMIEMNVSTHICFPPSR